MSNELEQLWQSLRESKLVANDIVEKLLHKGQSSLPPDADVAAGVEWLISRKAITKYQGKILAKGKSGPFFYGDYKVQDRLTSGSFSGCFQASHVGSGYPVLLRFATTEMVADPQRWSRIGARTSAQSRVEHDQLLKYFELVDLGAWKFVVFEARRGSTIGSKIDGGKRVNQNNACHLVRCAAEAIQSMHAANQVHGAVNPETLFLGADGNCWVHRDPLVEPFSILHPDAPALADYAAPEFLSSDAHATPASDIYSLGCVLYRMVSGATPFPDNHGSNAEAVLHRHANETPADLSGFGVEPGISDVVTSMMAVNPDHRPASMLAVAELLAPMSGEQKDGDIPAPSSRFTKYKKLLKKKLQPSEPPGLTANEATEHQSPTAAFATAHPEPAHPAPAHPEPANPAPANPATPISSDATVTFNPAETVAISASPVTSAPPIDPSMQDPSATAGAPPAAPLPPGVTSLPPGVQPVVAEATTPPPAPAPSSPSTIPPSTIPPSTVPPATAPPAIGFPDATGAPATGSPAAGSPAAGSPTTAMPSAVAPSAPTPPVNLPIANETPVSQRRRKRGPKRSTIIGLVVALLLLLPLMYLAKKALDAVDGPDVTQSEGETEGANEQTGGVDGNDGKGGKANGETGGSETAGSDSNGAFVQNIVDESDGVPEGKSQLWETPTVGAPINLDYVPSGLRLVLSLRPAEILQSEDGLLIEKALGEKFKGFENSLQQKTGVQFSAMDHVLVTFHDNDGKKPRPSFVVTLAAPVAKEQLMVRWGNPSPAPIEGKNVDYYLSGEDAFFIPVSETDDQQSVSRFVLTGVDQVVEMAEFDFAPPTMNIHLRTLLAKTDVERHFTMLSTPSFLFNDEGSQLFKGEYVKGLDSIRWLIDRDIQALMFSSHLEDDWYVELMLKGQVDRDPHQLSKDFEARVKEGSSKVASHAMSLGSNPYWDRVRNYLAIWLRKLVSGMRTGVEDRIMVANSWMPRVSAHNVIAGTELLLVSSGPGTGAATTVMVEPETEGLKKPTTLEELLTFPQSVDIPEDDLINAVNEIKLGVLDSVGNDLPFDFDMVMKGTDLQLEGITQNQKVINFKMDAPLNEVLTALVVKANPDPNSTGPKDELNKLIWVVGPHPKQPDQQAILITTRKAAARDMIELPPAFVADE